MKKFIIALILFPSLAFAGWLEDRFNETKKVVEKTTEAVIKTNPVTAPAVVAKKKIVDKKPIGRAVKETVGEAHKATAEATNNTIDLASNTANGVVDIQKNIVKDTLGDEASGVVEVVNLPSRQMVSYSTSLAKSATYVFETGDLEMIGNPELARASVILAAELQRSRDSHYASSKPLPVYIKNELSAIFSDDVLNRARYAVGKIEPTLQNIIGKGNKAFGEDFAVVADDVIVFSRQPIIDNLDDIKWWAHEVHHVKQYMDWGLLGFAKRYIKNFNAVESEARYQETKVALK